MNNKITCFCLMDWQLLSEIRLNCKLLAAKDVHIVRCNPHFQFEIIYLYTQIFLRDEF